MRVLERLCPQTWWQWAIYGVMAALLVLNVALANMQALDAAPRPRSHTPLTVSSPAPDALVSDAVRPPRTAPTVQK